MPMTRARRHRSVAATFALALVLAGCGGDSDAGSAPETTTTATGPAPSPTTSEPATTTTEAPRAFTEEELRGALLQAQDVPHHLVLEEKDPPPGWQPTEPPACGEQLAGDGPGAVRATMMFVEPDGFLAFESIAEHTPGKPEDLGAMRQAIAGPCSEPFRYVTIDGIDTQQRMTLLSDLDIGDDAFAARFDVAHTVEGYPAQTWAYMVYARRGDVSIQVQAITGEVPSVGVAGPDISLEEVERLARRLDERLVALQATR